MTVALDISDELQARVDAIARRSGRTPSEIVSDALDKGHSLAWQEDFLNKVAEGMDAAQRGDFASDVEIAEVLRRHQVT